MDRCTSIQLSFSGKNQALWQDIYREEGVVSSTDFLIETNGYLLQGVSPENGGMPFLSVGLHGPNEPAGFSGRLCSPYAPQENGIPGMVRLIIFLSLNLFDMKAFLWKVWLRLNLLTKEVDNDYIAEVSTVGKTLHNEDLARLIAESGSEIKPDTVLNILHRRDGLVRGKLQEGYSVQDGVSHISPRVTGNWHGAAATFDPKIHHICLDMTETAEMREALTHVGIEVLGVRDAGAFIGLVTDVVTGRTDGVITSGDDVVITGHKIRVEGAEGETDTGIFFHHATTQEVYPVTHRLTQNDPKKIIARTPALPAGKYALTIVTRYAGGKHLLQKVRTIAYASPLTVE
jgi:hypothetical protein